MIIEHKQQPTPEQLAQQKAYKESKESFRNAIIALSKEQGPLKEQRKTANFPEGSTRHMSSAAAASAAAKNKNQLRHMFIAYAVFRGRQIPEAYWNWNERTKKLEPVGTPPKKIQQQFITLSTDTVKELLNNHVVPYHYPQL